MWYCSVITNRMLEAYAAVTQHSVLFLGHQIGACSWQKLLMYFVIENF